ncbi:DUF4159 domain-containing protein [Alkalilacustris brevis]|uniref:DUF4159 domain-containing protein n=1 Tax=Alkalilacustris brevis TaxID=2026338 RepID=UPI000E0DAF41|nr:DUF4159 domain-containing protein [Alkalilacustris brevis]
MLTLGPLGFTAPALLLGLLALPLLWWLLRAVPPAPVVRRFPGVALLLGLRDEETQADRTPWWLLLLRLVAIAAVIIAFSGPVLNPRAEEAGSGPLLVIVDGSWANAPDWQRSTRRLDDLLADAARNARPVALAMLSDPPADTTLPLRPAEHWRGRLAGLEPNPWEPDAAEALAAALPEGGFETFWLSDGLAREGREALLATLEQRGPVTVFESPRPIYALQPARFEEGLIKITALRAAIEGAAPETEIEITAHGPDPAGNMRELARGTVPFDAGATEGELALSLQPELRNRITRFQITSQPSAGATSLTDDALQRRKVALLAPSEGREALELLSPLYYLRQALDPVADLITGGIDDILLANPDVVVFADVARVTDIEADMLVEWMEAGGLLLRFAGPRVAGSDISRGEIDPLMPVRLRAGGRTVGGAMSWGEPRALRPFNEESPFHGLEVPEDVTVSAQVLAQPDPALTERAIATLADGTPLVTRRHVGQGQVVLFHVTANAEWSTLPISGLFVQMLERLAVSTRPSRPGADELAGSTWVPRQVLDAFGAVWDAGSMAGIDGPRLADGAVSADLPPGIYAEGERRLALNAIAPERALVRTAWPANVRVEGVQLVRETPLKGAFLSVGLLALLIDVFATLWLSGQLPGQGRASRKGGSGRGAGAALSGWLLVPGLALALALVAPISGPALAQNSGNGAPADDRLALRATSEVVLAHVLTGDPRVDEVAEAGLRGLSRTLTLRTSVEPANPIGINLENDELAFFPFLYWPVTAEMPTPSDAAYARLNRYLRTGGMILFDTRDADMAGFGFSSPTGRRLQELARPLDIPPLETVPEDHVLTRTFYLIQRFPGRHDGEVWVEAAPPDTEQAEGMPFRSLNDGVTPVVIGGNDWAAAWATNERGQPMISIGRGQAGERQREIANRFGVNLIMHVLTGNYKSDQVHVPALLERLGQ